MKKVFTLLALVALTITSYAQRSIDWSLESVIEPSEMASNEQTGTAIPVKLECKNNGSDTLYAGDSIGYSVLIIDIVTSNIILQIPAQATSGQLYINLLDKDVAPGDTVHIGNNFTTTLIVGQSRDIRIGGNCLVFETDVTDSVAANNSLARDIIWYNPYRNGVGIDDVTYNNNLAIYPNPAKDEVSVKLLLTSHSDVKVELIDMSGKTVLSSDAKNTFNNAYSLNTQGLENGVYIVKVTNGDEVNTAKVTISH